MNASTVDKGQCESNPCYSGETDQCTSTHSHCCGAVGLSVVNAECEDGTTVPVYIVTSCGCTTCTANANVTVVGIAGGHDGTVLQYGDIYVNGVLLANTSESGQFSFEVDRGLERVSVLFVDNHNRYFTDNSYILQMPSEDQDSVSIRVYLLPRGNVTTFSASEETTLTSGDTNITIPANAFYTQDGQLHTVRCLNIHSQ